MRRTLAASLDLLALALLSIVAMLSVLVSPAFAASVDLSPFWAQVTPIVVAIVGAVVAAILKFAYDRFVSWTHVEIEAKYRDSIHSAAMTGINLAIAKAGGALPTSATIQSEVVASAVSWVISSVPDALKYLGLSPDQIGDLVEAKLGGLLSAQVTTATTVAPTNTAG